jgi:translocation and assembly module TamB
LTKQWLLGFLAIGVLIAAAAIGTLFFYINSPAFEQDAQQLIVREIEKRTGAQVSLENFDLAFREQRIRLEGLTLHGLEPATAPPLAHFPRIDAGIGLRTLLQRRIDLVELTIARPEIHVVIGTDGRTNIPSPPQTEARTPLDFRISIDKFTIADGTAFFNERRVNIDLRLANLSADIGLNSAAGILSSHLRYDGTLDRGGNKPLIPYTLDADLIYTRNTLLVERMEIGSNESLFKFQGRVNQLLTGNIAGRLEYAGRAEVPFLNYFFAREKFAGTAEAAGHLEFSRDHFFTEGAATSEAIDFENWHASRVKTDYSYHYPDRRAAFRNLRSQILDGTIEGSAIVENLPGPSRVLVDIDYAGIDAADLTRAYPWDPNYRIFSRMTGKLNGWFEGKLARFQFSGSAALRPYTDDFAGLVPFPLEGTAGYEAVPGQVRVFDADVRFYSTVVRADGLIDGQNSDLRVHATSSNLREIAFLYGDANGAGSFDGTLTGPIKAPLLTGAFTLEGHLFRGQRRIEHADGNVRLDTLSEMANLMNVRLTQGRSEVLVSGSAALDGSPVDLQVELTRVLGEDLTPLVDRPIGGKFAGAVHVTSFQPARLEGDVHVDDLLFENRSIGAARAHMRYFEPDVALTELLVRRGGTTLSGDIAYNPDAGRLKFVAAVRGIDLAELRDAGLPASLGGMIRQADIRGDGTRQRPNIRGEAVIENLAIFGEEFPQVRAELASADSTLNVTLDAARNLRLSARINTAEPGYPFASTATFTRYSLDRVAGMSEGTFSVTGSAALSGLLTDRNSLRGDGTIESAETQIEQRTLRTTAPFRFDFNPDRVMLTGVTLAGEGTEIRLAGTIGFTPGAPLGLDVSGRVDMGLLPAAYPEWFSSGSVNIEGRMTGTARDPDLRGVARFSNATFGRRGVFTSLSALTGELFFDQNRITVNNLQARVGGGTSRAQGTVVLDQRQIGSMNIRIDTDDVRLRYPEGLRTVVDSSLILQGTWESPLLQGNVQVQNLSYQSDFDQFLRLFQEGRLDRTPSPVGRLRLALHVEGNRNITIRNQLADVEARLDLDISGTVDDPTLTGHIEASGGTLVFQGTRYVITRGNIDFVDPLRIEPVIDIQAESELRDYRVILAISGRGDRLRLDMRSDPPLPQLEIVSLIAGGRTRDELAARPGGGAVPTSEQLFQGGAASILFDLLQSRVGNRFGLLGLDRVRIDPFLVGAENDPVARVTVSEQITKDLSITYSQDLSSNRQQIIQIEYFVSQNTSVVASRDEFGSLGLDLKFRTRFK